MSKNTATAEQSADNTVTVETLVAQAAEEKLVTPTVPAQAEGEKTEQCEPELTAVEDEKKSLKERVESLAEKLKANKKALIGLGAAVSFATVAFMKYAKAQATEVIELTDEDVEDESEQTDNA